MITLLVLLFFLTAIITVFWDRDTLARWNNFPKDKRNELIAAIQNLFKATKKDLNIGQTTRKTKEPNDFEESSEDVNIERGKREFNYDKQVELGSDSSQSHVKGFMGRRRK